jgi:hypothetical protein
MNEIALKVKVESMWLAAHRSFSFLASAMNF